MDTRRTIPDWLTALMLVGFVVMLYLGFSRGWPVGSLFLLTVLAVLYWIPSALAWQRWHRHQSAIIALNLLAGWTFVGWLVALCWALTAPAQRPAA